MTRISTLIRPRTTGTNGTFAEINNIGPSSDLIAILRRDGLAALRDPGEDPEAAAGRRRPPPLAPPHRLQEVEEPRRLHHLEEPVSYRQIFCLGLWVHEMCICGLFSRLQMFKYLPPKARTFLPGCQGRKGEEGDFVHCWSLLRKDLVRFDSTNHMWCRESQVFIKLGWAHFDFYVSPSCPPAKFQSH